MASGLLRQISIADPSKRQHKITDIPQGGSFLMTRLFGRGTVGVLAFALVVAALQSSPSANHSWNGYHWARTSNPFVVALGDDVNTAWDAYLANAANDWTQSLYGNPVRT